MFSWEYDILCTFLRYKAGSVQDTVIVYLGSAVLLALRRPLGHQLRGVHLRPMHLSAGKGHPLQKKDTSVTFWAERNFFLSYI